HLGRLVEALDDYGRSIGLREELVNRDGRHELRNNLALAYLNRGALLGDLGRPEEALADLGRSVGLIEELMQREGRRELCRDLAKAYAAKAALLLPKQRKEVCQLAREAVSILETEVTRTGRAD